MTVIKHAHDSLMRFSRNLSPGIGRLTDMVVTGGKGSYFWTDQGEKFLDFATGIGVTNTGHCHPKVVGAIKSQADKMLHAQINISYHDQMLELVGKMLELMPMTPKEMTSRLDNFFFWNSGAEAVEAAVKLARHATKKQSIIVFRGSYHGRTIGTMAMTTSKTIFRAGYGPFMPGVHVAPYPYCAHCTCPKPPGGGCCGQPLEDLELMLRQECDPNEVAAVFIEPIQGEGGYLVPPDDFLQGVRDLCDKYNILMVADEVQCGAGRTGKMWAVQNWGVVPDILIFAKGIASGMPLSGIVTTTDLARSQPAGSMGGTYAGNIVACAAANATLDVFEEENVFDNVKARGKQLKEGLQGIIERGGYADKIKDLRGIGLMVGLEFDAEPGTGVAMAVSKACLARGMVLLTTSAFETIRFIPALTISEKEMSEGLSIIEEALVEVLARDD